MEEVLKYRSQIYGFCAVWIVMHHLINLHGIPGFSYIPFVYPFIRMGSCGVDVFLFLSGYCLCLSYAKDSNLKHFYRKRIVRLLIPYLIIAVLYYLWRNSTIGALEDGTLNLRGFAQDITGISFLTKGMMNTWFVDAIAIFYLLFPLLYSIISKGKGFAIVLLVLSYVILFLGYFLPFPGFDNYAIAISRFPVFLFGLIMAIYNGCAPKYNRKTLVISVILLIVLIGIFPIKNIQESNNLHGIFLWVPYISLVLPVVYLSRLIFQYVGGAFWSFLGDLSLEIYMVHVFIINILKWYGWDVVLGIGVWIFIPLLSVPIAFCVSKLSHKVQLTFSK